MLFTQNQLSVYTPKALQIWKNIIRPDTLQVHILIRLLRKSYLYIFWPYLAQENLTFVVVLNEMLSQMGYIYSIVYFHIYRFLAVIHPTTQTPLVATVLTGVLSALLSLLVSLQLLVELMSIGNLIKTNWSMHAFLQSILQPSLATVFL